MGKARILTWAHGRGYEVRDVLQTLRQRVETGLLTHHPMVEASKYFPATPSFRGRTIENVTFKDDKIRDEFYEAFPDEADKLLKLFPGVTTWYEDPADVWIKTQVQMMKENDLTFQQAWDIMMYNYRKKLHLERLEKQYQLQQLQEAGAQIMPKATEAEEEVHEEFEIASRLIDRQEEDIFMDKIWSKIERNFRLSNRTGVEVHYTYGDPTISEENFPNPPAKLRFEDFDQSFPQQRIWQFIQINPNLKFMFHDEWFYDIKYMELVFPMSTLQEYQMEKLSETIIAEEEAQIPTHREVLLEEEALRKRLEIVNYPIPYASFLEEKFMEEEFPIDEKDAAAIFHELGIHDHQRELEVNQMEREKALADLRILEQEFDMIIDSVPNNRE